MGVLGHSGNHSSPLLSPKFVERVCGNETCGGHLEVFDELVECIGAESFTEYPSSSLDGNRNPCSTWAPRELLSGQTSSGDGTMTRNGN